MMGPLLKESIRCDLSRAVSDQTKVTSTSFILLLSLKETPFSLISNSSFWLTQTRWWSPGVVGIGNKKV